MSRLFQFLICLCLVFASFVQGDFIGQNGKPVDEKVVQSYLIRMERYGLITHNGLTSSSFQLNRFLAKNKRFVSYMTSNLARYGLITHNGLIQYRDPDGNTISFGPNGLIVENGFTVDAKGSIVALITSNGFTKFLKPKPVKPQLWGPRILRF